LKITNFATTATVVAIVAVLFVPGWLDANHALRDARRFSTEASLRHVEARVVRSTKYVENPFTWNNGMPTLVAARQPIGENFIVLYTSLSDGKSSMSKVLISANCADKKLRFVSQEIYENQLAQSGYDILGNKLPDWSQAGYDAMLAVMLGQPYSQANTSVFFDIACHWDRYHPVSA
jgi:hypothetical protein